MGSQGRSVVIDREWTAMALALGLACGCGGNAGPDDGDSGSDATDGEEAEPVPVSASGHAFDFGPSGGRVEGAVVTIPELPGLSTTTGADGEWAFHDLVSGTTLSFSMSMTGFPVVQTGTITLGPEGAELVTFQAPTQDMFDYMADLVGIVPDPARCQIATTVTRMGNSLYDTTPGTHGEPYATVTSEPPIPAGSGPIYFNLVTAGIIFPDPDLTETTDDGGVLWVNVEPGTYVLTAHKPDTVFRDVVITCRAGVVVNASPPWGLQAIEGGVGPRE